MQTELELISTFKKLYFELCTCQVRVQLVDLRTMIFTTHYNKLNVVYFMQLTSISITIVPSSTIFAVVPRSVMLTNAPPGLRVADIRVLVTVTRYAGHVRAAQSWRVSVPRSARLAELAHVTCSFLRVAW